jgi:hypothetical protein
MLINQVGRFFALRADSQMRRGVHRSAKELEADIQALIDPPYASARRFRSSRSAED